MNLNSHSVRVLRRWLILAISGCALLPHITAAQSLLATGQTFSSKNRNDIPGQINCLPQSYLDAVRQDIPAKGAADILKHLQGASTDDCHSLILSSLVSTPDGRSFLFLKVETEPAAELRRQVFHAIYSAAQSAAFDGSSLMTGPESKVLEKHAASDSDVEASLEALRALREFHTADEAALLRTREARASATDSRDDLKKMEDLRLERYAWYGEIRLSPFTYVPSSPFSVVPADRPIRVLAFGDFGTGSDGQIKDASAMASYHKQHPFDFGLTLGDNFYNSGLSTLDSPRWQTQWENLYGPLNIKFYPVYGNHDYGDPDSPAAELAYTAKSKSWVFPAPYYTFTAGAAQFFAIDNIRLTNDELAWLDKELGKSTAKWKIVYGHYHIYSATRGDNDMKEDNLIGRLLPVLEKNHVQIYLNGHDHNMQEARTESPVHFFTSGAGGAGLYDLQPTYKKSIFKEKQFGFTVLEIDDTHADVIFVDSEGKEIYRSHISQ
jgi:tartrate-resistant acid phosphatase type 5